MRWLDGISDAMNMNLGKLRRWWRKRGLACCSPWGRRESDTTGQLNNKVTEMRVLVSVFFLEKKQASSDEKWDEGNQGYLKSPLPIMGGIAKSKHPSGEIKTRWAAGVSLEHCGYLPLTLKGACELRKGRDSPQLTALVSVFCRCFGACVQCSASLQMNRPPDRKCLKGFRWRFHAWDISTCLSPGWTGNKSIFLPHPWASHLGIPFPW